MGAMISAKASRPPMSLVPAHPPIRVGAALTGHSEPTFRRHVLPLVLSEDGRVSLTGLERYLEREITPTDYLAAVKALEPRRARERNYRHKGEHVASKERVSEMTSGDRPSLP